MLYVKESNTCTKLSPDDLESIKDIQARCDRLQSEIDVLYSKHGINAALRCLGECKNLLYSCYDYGFYYYRDGCAGAPSQHSGYMIVLRESLETNLVRIAFSTDGNVYYCVQRKDGTVAISWKAL